MAHHPFLATESAPSSGFFPFLAKTEKPTQSWQVITLKSIGSDAE
jgi:hypothetical protein